MEAVGRLESSVLSNDSSLRKAASSIHRQPKIEHAHERLKQAYNHYAFCISHTLSTNAFHLTILKHVTKKAL